LLNTNQKINFVELSKYLCRTLKLVARISKFFAALLIIFKVLTKLFFADSVKNDLTEYLRY